MRHVRIGITLALALYGAALLAAGTPGSTLDEINLAVHDTGHLIFAPFGTTLGLLGGSVLQLVFPFAFAAWFTQHRDEHAASVGVWWVGQNFLSIGAAMRAAAGPTPSVSGASDRDWSALFGQWGVLPDALHFGGLAVGFGYLVMLVATFWGIAEATTVRHPVATPRIRYAHARRR